MKLNPERIIVNSHSALGDTMEYQPFFLMLRTMFPQAEIHCVCNQNTMLLAKLIPGRCDRYSPLWEECRGPNELNRDEFNRRFVDCVKHGFSDGKPADLIILMDRRTELIKLALSTDCPHVVTFSYFLGFRARKSTRSSITSISLSALTRSATRSALHSLT